MVEFVFSFSRIKVIKKKIFKFLMLAKSANIGSYWSRTWSQYRFTYLNVFIVTGLIAQYKCIAKCLGRYTFPCLLTYPVATFPLHIRHIKININTIQVDDNDKSTWCVFYVAHVWHRNNSYIKKKNQNGFIICNVRKYIVLLRFPLFKWHFPDVDLPNAQISDRLANQTKCYNYFIDRLEKHIISITVFVSPSMPCYYMIHNGNNAEFF